MPSDLNTGFLWKFLRVSKRLTVKATGVISMEGRAAPSSCAVGDLYMTTAGVLKVCTTAGTPGTWTSVGAQT